MTDEQFTWWLVGLVDGEGHFGVTKSSTPRRPGPYYRCVFRVGMVAEDAPILRMARERTGWGSVYEYDARGGRRAVAIWTVTTKQVAEVAAFFGAYPLQSKKAAEFEVWAPAARAQARRAQRGNGRRDDAAAAEMEIAYETLRALDRGGRLRAVA